MSHILQWNCRGLRTSACDLQAVLSQHSPLAVCLQETKLLPDSPCSIKGYSVFRKDVQTNTVAHGGVLLAVHHSLPSQQLKLRAPLQAVAARVLINHRPFTICSLYLPPGISLPRVELSQLASELPDPKLILGDFNAHHTLWGCQDVDARGRVLERFICEESLGILNTGTRTHFTMPSGSTSVLDLSLVSPQLMPLFTWHVADDPLGSDHFPVWLQHQGVPVLGSRPPRWNLGKADWTEFESLLETSVLTRDDTSTLSAEDFTSLLLNCAEKCIPRTSSRPRRCPVPWWTDECRDAIRARKRAFKKFDRDSTTPPTIWSLLGKLELLLVVP